MTCKTWLKKPESQQHINAGLAIAWLIFGIVGAFTGIKYSIAVLFFISVYANAAGHVAAWQGAKAESNQGD